MHKGKNYDEMCQHFSQLIKMQLNYFGCIERRDKFESDPIRSNIFVQ